MTFLLENPPGYAKLRFTGVSPAAEARLANEGTTPILATPIAAEDAIVEDAIKELKKSQVDWGDVRLGRDLNRQLVCQDDNISRHTQSSSQGIGIRAFYKGFWGFAATDDLSPQGIKGCVAEASGMAKAVAAVTPAALGTANKFLAQEPAHKAEYHTTVGECPFDTPAPMIGQVFIEGAALALTLPGITRVMAEMNALGYRRIFANTEGAFIKKSHAIVDAFLRVHAVHNGTSAYRTFVVPGIAGGLEHFFASGLAAAVPSLCREALAKCSAQKVASGNYDLILDGHNLALTMHESVGHPTELDRVLGYEFGFAGGSFAGLDKLGHFRYGSKLVNFTGNNRLRYGGATVGFDDEGVEGQSFPLIREGILVGYGTNRETAHHIGQRRANGTCRATHWYDAPIVRIPNLFLEPGTQRLALDDLIADTKDGILMLGNDSFSIDQMRYNFQFGANMCYRIRGGKLAEPVRDVIYQAITPEFWNACDAICDERAWQLHGIVNCGKGQPGQSAQMMHGASPSRFRQIKVGF